MALTGEVLSFIKELSLADRLLLVEEILRNIREENFSKLDTRGVESPMLKFVGIFDKNETSVFGNAIVESRKVDLNDW